MFSYIILYSHIFYCLIVFTSGDIGQYVIAIVCYPACDVINFEIYLGFLVKRFSYMNKIQNKNLNVSRTKKLSGWNKKAFFIIFKGLSIARNRLRHDSTPLMSHRPIL